VSLVGLLFGIAFGFLLTGAGIGDYDVVHRMLHLQEPDLYLLMASTVAVAVPLLLILQKAGWRTPFGGPLTITRSRVERKHVLGGITFGIGWAIAGTCPGAVLTMVGTGSLLGLVVIVGLFLGLILRDGKVPTTSPRLEAPEGRAG
jgi:uncharacterized membrane protein YedE/YeeE